MKPERFRDLALELPEVEEGSHQGHADFRVGGKIFATLGPADTRAMVRLPVDDQAERLASRPEVFAPSPGAWGRQGCTEVDLPAARVAEMRDALVSAWCARAPKAMLKRHPQPRP